MVGVPEAWVPWRIISDKPTRKVCGHFRVRLVTTGSLFSIFLSGRVPYSMALRKVTPVLLHGINMCVSFYHLISVLCNEHMLTLPRNSDKLVLHTDASKMGTGAELSVIQEDLERPGLSAAEKNYTVSELECLAVVKAIDHLPSTYWGASLPSQDLGWLNGCLMGTGTPSIWLCTEVQTRQTSTKCR